MSPLSPEAISVTLLKWYQNNRRELPWRNTSNPYFIWLSEIILQQTRIEQGLPYFIKFKQRFPKVQDLAKASENEVLKLWQGLGYYTRARNLHATSKIITDEFGGKFPADYHKIRELKGIGDYTAAAIASFAFGKPVAVVDGNVFRFLSRIFGEFSPIDSSLGKKIFASLASEILNQKEPGLHNQAIMEFGALHCRPLNPGCNECPFQNGCIAFRSGQVQQLPVKSKTATIKNRYFNYLLVHYKKKIYFNQRSQGDIWAQLYELPLIESERKLSLEKLMNSEGWKNYFRNNTFHIRNDRQFKVHKLSHQHIHARMIDVEMKDQPKKLFVNSFISIKPEEMHDYPVSRLMETMLETSVINYATLVSD